MCIRDSPYPYRARAYKRCRDGRMAYVSSTSVLALPVPHSPECECRRFRAEYAFCAGHRSRRVYVPRPTPAWHYFIPVSYTHLRAHETPEHLVCRLLLEKKKKKN